MMTPVFPLKLKNIGQEIDMQKTRGLYVVLVALIAVLLLVLKKIRKFRKILPLNPRRGLPLPILELKLPSWRRIVWHRNWAPNPLGEEIFGFKVLILPLNSSQTGVPRGRDRHFWKALAEGYQP